MSREGVVKFVLAVRVELKEGTKLGLRSGGIDDRSICLRNWEASGSDVVSAFSRSDKAQTDSLSIVACAMFSRTTSSST